MASWDKIFDGFVVLLDRLDHSLVLEFPLDCKLLVDLSRETRHERFEHHAQKEQSIERCVDNLLASSLVALSEDPGLILLEVEVAVRRVSHSNSETIFQFDGFHQGVVLFELLK